MNQIEKEITVLGHFFSLYIEEVRGSWDFQWLIIIYIYISFGIISERKRNSSRERTRSSYKEKGKRKNRETERKSFDTREQFNLFQTSSKKNPEIDVGSFYSLNGGLDDLIDVLVDM